MSRDQLQAILTAIILAGYLANPEGMGTGEQDRASARNHALQLLRGVKSAE